MRPYQLPSDINGFEMWYSGSMYVLDLNVFQSFTTCHGLRFKRNLGKE